jgi:uncharacterized protein YlxW (UPF0749 family)
MSHFEIAKGILAEGRNIYVFKKKIRNELHHKKDRINIGRFIYRLLASINQYETSINQYETSINQYETSINQYETSINQSC